MSAYEQVFSAVTEYLSSWCVGDADRLRQVLHPEGHAYSLGPTGNLVDMDTEALLTQAAAAQPPPNGAARLSGRVHAVTVLDDCTAVVKAELARPLTEDAPLVGFLVLLRDGHLGWRIISEVATTSSVAAAGTPDIAAAQRHVSPAEFVEVVHQIRDGYMESGRAGDAACMARTFHPMARLTFAEHGSVCIINCADFCRRVGKRWESDLHRPFAHLRSDPRIKQADTLLGVDFAGHDCALVTLKIGYPPCLYTDVLSLLDLRTDVERGGWWIVAKSSVKVPFLAEEAR